MWDVTEPSTLLLPWGLVAPVAGENPGWDPRMALVSNIPLCGSTAHQKGWITELLASQAG